MLETCTSKRHLIHKLLFQVSALGEVDFAGYVDHMWLSRIFENQASVTHAILTIGSRDQEDHSSKSTWANTLRDPISKKKKSQKGLVEWFKV
jgi:hypothetical protein